MFSFLVAKAVPVTETQIEEQKIIIHDLGGKISGFTLSKAKCKHALNYSLRKKNHFLNLINDKCTFYT